MTDETIDEEANSDKNIQQRRKASVERRVGPSHNPDAYMVKYEDGSVHYEPATPENIALFDEDLSEEIEGSHRFRFDSSRVVDATVDLQNKEVRISRGGTGVRVPGDRRKDAILAFKKAKTGEHLAELYDEITEGQVRRGIVEEFLDLFPSDRIEITADGWVIDDTFIVNYDAENYLQNNNQIYIVSGGGVREASEEKQAVDLSFTPDIRAERLQTPKGDKIELEPVEQKFLSTVECLLFPENYLDAQLVDDVEQVRQASQSTNKRISELAETVTIGGFTDSKSGVHHSHDFNKHRASRELAEGTVDQELGMTERAAQQLYFNDYDHAAPHEIWARREEFKNAPFDVFENAENDDWKRWTAVENAKDKAPIGPENREKIRKMFGGN